MITICLTFYSYLVVDVKSPLLWFSSMLTTAELRLQMSSLVISTVAHKNVNRYQKTIKFKRNSNHFHENKRFSSDKLKLNNICYRQKIALMIEVIINLLTHLSIDISLRHERHFYGSTLKLYNPKNISAFVKIIFQSL